MMMMMMMIKYMRENTETANVEKSDAREMGTCCAARRREVSTACGKRGFANLILLTHSLRLKYERGKR